MPRPLTIVPGPTRCTRGVAATAPPPPPPPSAQPLSRAPSPAPARASTQSAPASTHGTSTLTRWTGSQPWPSNHQWLLLAPPSRRCLRPPLPRSFGATPQGPAASARASRARGKEGAGRRCMRAHGTHHVRENRRTHRCAARRPCGATCPPIFILARRFYFKIFSELGFDVMKQTQGGHTHTTALGPTDIPHTRHPRARPTPAGRERGE